MNEIKSKIFTRLNIKREISIIVSTAIFSSASGQQQQQQNSNGRQFGNTNGSNTDEKITELDDQNEKTPTFDTMLSSSHHQQQQIAVTSNLESSSSSSYADIIYKDLETNEYDTPEQITKTKVMMKYLAAKAGGAQPREAKRREKDHHWLVPFPAVQLFSTKEPCRIDVTNVMEDLVLDPTTINTVQSINAIIKQYGQQFIGSIILFKDYFIFVTAVDGFMHQSVTDDGADRGPFKYYERATAVMKEKTFHGTKFYELAIHIGHLELSVVSGFFGLRLGCSTTPFLGSSIPNLSIYLQQATAAATILASTITSKLSQTMRTLRQHAK